MTPAKPIRIYVDADACPVKDEIYRVAARHGLHVLVVANGFIRVPQDPAIERIAAGRTPHTKVLRLDPGSVDRHAARALGVPLDEPLVYCERLRSADGGPLAVMHNWLPARFHDITAADLEESGLYQLLGERHARPAVARQRITAQAAGAAEARLLGIRRNAPLISMRRTAFDPAGHPVEFAEHLYRADLYAIEVTVHNR